MNRIRLLQEVALTENSLMGLDVEGALMEAMKIDVIAEIIIAEQRKIVRYATQHGIIDSRSLNEGFFADAALGIGQAVGSIPGLAQMGVGAAFGAAGVLYYGSKVLKSSGFDLIMNVIFTLLSSAAIEPTGIFGGAGALGKLIKPFASLGKWARGLGGAIKTGARAAYEGLPAASRLIVNGAVRAEGPLMSGLNLIEKQVVPRVSQIFTSIAETVSKLPGGNMFQSIVKRVTELAGWAIKELRPMIESLINLGKNALGKGAEKVAGKVAGMSGRAQAKAVNAVGHAAGLGDPAAAATATA